MGNRKINFPSVGTIASIVLIIVFLIFQMQCSPASENVTKILNDLMKKPYDKRVRPFLGENALFVRVSFNLDAFLDVNELNSEISIRMTLRQSWLEPRLTFTPGAIPNDTIQLGPEQSRFLWLPDTTMGNQRRVNKMEGQEFTFLSYEGLITTSVKVGLTFDCAISYDDFPFDTQMCSVNLFSNTHDRRDIIYEWMTEESTVGGDRLTPLTVGRFQLISYETKTSTISTQQASIILVLRLHFQALWKRFLISTFLPLISFTGISLASLWILSFKLGILVNLLNIALLNVFLAVLMRDGNIHIYDTEIGQYLSLCLCFVLSTLFVQLLSTYLENHPRENDAEDCHGELPGVTIVLDEINTGTGLVEENPSSSRRVSMPRVTTHSTVNYRLKSQLGSSLKAIRLGFERFSRHAYWILPGGFIVLNLIYFGANINSQESRVEHVMRKNQS